MMGGWSHLMPWHADATNAAGMLRILAMHVDMINYNPTMMAANVSYGYHANDNAFLNYGDAWFLQRTLNTRFEMNLTHTVEVVRKPAINTMVMLSLLGDTRHRVSWKRPASSGEHSTRLLVDAPPATPTSAPYGAIATSGTTADGVQTVGVLLWNSNGTQRCHTDCNASVQLDLSSLVPSSSEAIGAVGAGSARTGVRIYRMDLTHGNPSAVFMAQRSNEPNRKPYPTPTEFDAIRAASELPSCAPTLLSANDKTKGTGFGSCDGISVATAAARRHGGDEAVSTFVLPLPQPSAALVHVCIAPVAGPPSAEWPADGANLRLRTTTTPGEVFIRWDDVESKCVGTYELFYHHEGEVSRDTTANIIPSETLFTAFVHQQAGPVATGCYSVRWKNIWERISPMSAAVCVKPGEGDAQLYVNA
eukprot:COSAG03_NODE_229_length_10305_cov_30.967085_4_plen_419_part_00